MAIDYQDRETSYELFVDAKRQGTWDPDEFSYEQDRKDVREFTDAEREYFMAFSAGFYDGEENVTRTLTPYLTAIEKLEDPSFDPVQAEMYLTTQLFEEAKHTDFFSRYFDEVFGTQDTAALTESDEDEEADDGYHTDDLYALHDDLLETALYGTQEEIVHGLAEAVTLYMGLIENQHAKVGYVQYEQMFEKKERDLGRTVLPGFQRGLTRIREDEGRHIRNGQWLMAKLAEMDESVVTEVYEPIFQNYLEKRLPPELDPNPFDVDEAPLVQCAKQSLETTINWVGPEKFDSLTDVGTAFESNGIVTPADD
jgi:ribonucleoside-diphosphate reductase beta chain